jgi:hypothetical protein
LQPISCAIDKSLSLSPISPVVILATITAAPITSPGRYLLQTGSHRTIVWPPVAATVVYALNSDIVSGDFLPDA